MLCFLQAKDARFCNAGVEFDLASLRPTYRLVWGSVAASNALAVAEGLGFDPLVIREARKVLTDTIPNHLQSNRAMPAWLMPPGGEFFLFKVPALNGQKPSDAPLAGIQEHKTTIEYRAFDAICEITEQSNRVDKRWGH